MNNYKVVVGYIQLRDMENGEYIEDGKKFPITPFNIIVDSKEVENYLIAQMDIHEYELIPQEKNPIYLEHELN